MKLTPDQQFNMQATINMLANACTKIARDQTMSLTWEEKQAVRAMADHATQEAAAKLGLNYEGKKAEAHEPLDWFEALVYAGDPF